MYQAQEQLVAATRAQMENAMRMTNVALRGFEQVLNLQIEVAKDALAEGTTGVRAFANAKAPSDVMQMHERFVKPNVEKAQTYAVEMYGVACDVRRELDELVAGQIAGFNKTLAEVLDQAAKTAPKGTDQAVAAMRSALVTANAAAENINRLAKQMAATADANVASFMQAAGRKTKRA